MITWTDSMSRSNDERAYKADGTSLPRRTYYGLSTDTKPTTGVGNGSAFIEMNTGKLYFYNAAGSAWVEWGA